jgi:DNA-binding HxlR family transcriptional regulator
MLGRTYDAEVCSAARTLEVVGERWTLLIVRNALFAGATRFSDYRSLGIATNILKTRLDTLVTAGIMERCGAADANVEYLLTAKGRELATIVVALTEWGDRWDAPDGPPVVYTHTGCGGEVSLASTCANCGVLHDPAELTARPGPGMPADRAARMSARL